MGAETRKRDGETDLSIDTIEWKVIYLWYCIVAILLYYTLRPSQVLFLGLRKPPVNQVTITIKLSSLVIKPVCDLVTNHPANSSIVHV